MLVTSTYYMAGEDATRSQGAARGDFGTPGGVCAGGGGEMVNFLCTKTLDHITAMRQSS